MELNQNNIGSFFRKNSLLKFDHTVVSDSGMITISSCITPNINEPSKNYCVEQQFRITETIDVPSVISKNIEILIEKHMNP